MGSSLPTEKLGQNNYASWEYKMHQYLLGHGYWNDVDGANDEAPEVMQRDFVGLGTSSKPSLVLLGIWPPRSDVRIHEGCKVVQRSLAESEEDFH